MMDPDAARGMFPDPAVCRAICGACLATAAVMLAWVVWHWLREKALP